MKVSCCTYHIPTVDEQEIDDDEQTRTSGRYIHPSRHSTRDRLSTTPPRQITYCTYSNGRRYNSIIFKQERAIGGNRLDDDVIQGK
jgi:hypothetical protein